MFSLCQNDIFGISRTKLPNIVGFTSFPCAKIAFLKGAGQNSQTFQGFAGFPYAKMLCLAAAREHFLNIYSFYEIPLCQNGIFGSSWRELLSWKKHANIYRFYVFSTRQNGTFGSSFGQKLNYLWVFNLSCRRNGTFGIS